MKNLSFCFLIFSLLFFSCRARKEKNAFADRDKQDQFYLEKLRKQPTVVSPYAKLKGEVKSADSGNVYRYYELRGIRVYCTFDSTSAVTTKNLLGVGTFGTLFATAVLNGGMFFCPAKTLIPCEPAPDSLTLRTGQNIQVLPIGQYGYYGPAYKIGSVRWLMTEGNRRWFEFRAAKLGTTEINVYFVGLENNSCTEKSSFAEFFSNAKLINFTAEYSEI